MGSRGSSSTRSPVDISFGEIRPCAETQQDRSIEVSPRQNPPTDSIEIFGGLESCRSFREQAPLVFFRQVKVALECETIKTWQRG